MVHNFPYLKDYTFLKEFDQIKLKEQFIKVTVLTFDEEPIQQIQGKVINGNISIDGSSSMRRTANITMIADEYENDLTTTRNLLSINKKVEILIGFTNTTNRYKEFDILWFPQGIYVIISPTITNSAEGVNISLTLHDKMAFLNGECGGTLPSSVVFHQMEDVDEEGNIYIVQPKIYQIIQQLVHHFGNQPIEKIIVSDIEDRIKRVMKWTGSTPLYIIEGVDSSGAKSITLTTEKPSKTPSKDKIKSYGQDVGYIYSDFVYPTDLISKPGDTITSILDQIKKTLGNYQYFYDINGNFRFQEVKNYLNKSYASTEVRLNKLNSSYYLTDYIGGKSVYTFDDATIISSFSNAPQYQQIKNDFLVWGKRTSISGDKFPIRYHLVIDEKPQIEIEHTVFFVHDPDDIYDKSLMKAKKPLFFTNSDYFPRPGDVTQYYYAEETKVMYKWGVIKQKEGEDPKMGYIRLDPIPELKTIVSQDFRTQLYLQGVESQPYGLDSNYYYTELKNQWPKLYDVESGQYKENQLSSIDYFLDFIDSPQMISQFGVKNIGRRTVVIQDDSINCLFKDSIPDLVIIETSTPETSELVNECTAIGQDFTQVGQNIYINLLTGGSLHSAYDEVKKQLYQYTNYNEQVSLTTLPIYYLEPNTRITILDPLSGISGDYIIKTISLSLDVSGNMSISCYRAAQR